MSSESPYTANALNHRPVAAIFELRASLAALCDCPVADLDEECVRRWRRQAQDMGDEVARQDASRLIFRILHAQRRLDVGVDIEVE